MTAATKLVEASKNASELAERYARMAKELADAAIVSNSRKLSMAADRFATAAKFWAGTALEFAQKAARVQ